MGSLYPADKITRSDKKVPDLPNIILIVLDTMRKDGIGIYGGSAITPFLDEFAKDSVVYNNCIAPATWTIPSHVSLFTGEYPSVHGIHETYSEKSADVAKKMDRSAPTIQQYLRRQRGYNTLAVSANPIVSPEYGLAEFNWFNVIDQRRVTPEERADIRRVSSYAESANKLALYLISHGKFGELAHLYSVYRGITKREKVMEYPDFKGGKQVIQNVRDSQFGLPFFLFINFLEMHDPYVKSEMSLGNDMPGVLGTSMQDLIGSKPLPEKTIQEIRQSYYASATRLDSLFGQLLSYFKGKRLYDNSLIIVTSDHGQALKEKNYYGHGIFLYDHIVEIPLIVKYPGNKVFKAPSEGYQSLTNISRLIQGLTEGETSKDLLTNETVFSEAFGIPHRILPEKFRKIYDVPRAAIFRKGYKLVVNPTTLAVEEFSFKGRPMNPSSENRETVKSLTDELVTLKRAERRIDQNANKLTAEDEELITERLRSLGYQ